MRGFLGLRLLSCALICTFWAIHYQGRKGTWNIREAEFARVNRLPESIPVSYDSAQPKFLSQADNVVPNFGMLGSQQGYLETPDEYFFFDNNPFLVLISKPLIQVFENIGRITRIWVEVVHFCAQNSSGRSAL
jgi:hypothetical protein